MVYYLYIVIASIATAAGIVLAGLAYFGTGPFHNTTTVIPASMCFPIYSSKTMDKLDATEFDPAATHTSALKDVNASQLIRSRLSIDPRDSPVSISLQNSAGNTLSAYRYRNASDAIWILYYYKSGDTLSTKLGSTPNGPITDDFPISDKGDYFIVIKNTGSHHFIANGTVSILSREGCR
jgi:hypothetical protein